MNVPPRPYRRGIPKPALLLIPAIVILLVVAAYFVYTRLGVPSRRTANLYSWLTNPASHPDWRLEAGTRCGDAPFEMPTSGYIGFTWGDSFRIGHSHQGLDIFGGEEVNQTPVYAAYDGYLTRLEDWKSSLIIRIPTDPLEPARQIWTYYTHLADSEGNSFIDAAFPPGTTEMFVEAGTLLGYQGNFSGDPLNPTGIHLHFSIVMDDGNGKWLNELERSNTLDPSPYFGMLLNAQDNPEGVPACP